MADMCEIKIRDSKLSVGKSRGTELKKTVDAIPSIVSSVVVFIFSVFFLFPFYWMITSSFKMETVTAKIPPDWIPINPTLENYRILFFEHPIFRWYANSIGVSLATTIMVVLVSSMAGYVLAKKNFTGKMIIFWMLIVTMTLPKQILLVPLFILMKNLRLFDSLIGLVLPWIGWPFGVFLLKQYMQTIPSELLEASRIDGCSEIRTFAQIVLPVAKPGIGALAIFIFMMSWNDYMWQLILLNTKDNLTIPLAVARLASTGEKMLNFGLLMAGACLASLPMFLVFIFFQKYFQRGLTMGAVKG
jgi:multiple sugar transport system permease protein